MTTLGRISWLVSLLAVSSVTACKSDDDGGGGGSNSLGSGVDSDKPANDLTDEEAESICEAGADYAQEKYSFDKFAPTLCRYAAAFAAVSAPTEDSMKSICEAGYDLCMGCMDDPEAEGCEEFPTEPDFTEGVDCSTVSVPGDDCSSTAGELEACYKALIDQPFEITTDVPSCDAINPDSEVPDLDLEQELPAACETVEENCPEFLE